MSYQCFDVDIKDHIAHVVLSRPEKRNSMNLAFWDELPQLIHEVDQNDEVRVVVLSSTGPHFCAGLDVQEFFNASQQSDVDERTARITNGASFYSRVTFMQASISSLEACRKPVIAAIQGGCIGGGVDLVTACDMRYASADAFFKVEEINIGMTADVGTFPRLTKILPDGIVREICYTGRAFSASEAQGFGLVNGVADDQDAMLEHVMDVARQIASKAPLAVYGTKHILNYCRDHTTADVLDYIAIWNSSMLQPEEMMEAMAAKMQKREGSFVALPKVTKAVSKP